MQSTYTVTGMTCGHCVAHVTEEVESLPGVTDVQVTLDDGRLVITSEAPVDLAAVKDAVAEAGSYEVVPA
jgi:copper chaperone